MMGFDNLPACCRNCHNLESESGELGPPFWYCDKGVFWPAKKHTCKKQRPYLDRLIANENAADCKGEG